MAQNPMAVLAAMLGGGFSGYADTKVRKQNTLNQDRLFNLQYDQFKTDSALNRDRLGLDAELGRGGLNVSRNRLDLDNRLGTHTINYDWARLRQDAEQRAADRASEEARTRMSAGATARNRSEEDRHERQVLGRSYQQQWLRDVNEGGPSAVLAYKALTDMRRMVGGNKNIDPDEAAYFIARRNQSPGGANWVERIDPNKNTGTQAFRPGGATPATSPQANVVAPTPQTPTAGADSPRAKWDAEADRLIDEGLTPEEIRAKLGPRPPQ